MSKHMTFFTTNLVLLSGVVLFAGSTWADALSGNPANALTRIADTTFESDAQSLAGTWQYSRGDVGATYRITLDLRADGTYTKTLQTNIGAGGTHSGTWTSQGTIVYLSGDGNWPAYSHDLAGFRRVN